ncbi:MAG: hypothetical protein U1A78_34550 [Polyangia bacterium]
MSRPAGPPQIPDYAREALQALDLPTGRFVALVPLAQLVGADPRAALAALQPLGEKALAYLGSPREGLLPLVHVEAVPAWLAGLTEGEPVQVERRAALRALWPALLAAWPPELVHVLPAGYGAVAQAQG